MADVSQLQLVCESKIGDLLSDRLNDNRWEASGVLCKDSELFIVFDDRAQIARIAADLKIGDKNRLVGTHDEQIGFEGIAYNADKQRYYLLVEAVQCSKTCCQGVVVEYDDAFDYVKRRLLDFDFKSDNKGFEAIAHRRLDGKDYLLALCEGNKCRCGKKGRTPGGGRIQLFEKRKSQWRRLGSIALPLTLPFVDYSGMSLRGERLVVVSQENSMLWIGEFDRDKWQWQDDGQLYEFPRDDDGSILYGNIEGVSWMSPSRVVAVSDRRKKSSQPDKRLSEKDQSIHIFDVLPT